MNPAVRVEQELEGVPVAPDSSSEANDANDDSANRRGGGGSGGGVEGLSRHELEKEREELLRLRRRNPDLAPSVFLWKDFGERIFFCCCGI